MYGVEPEAVEVVLLEPHQDVRTQEASNRRRVRAVEVEAAAPVAFMIGEVPIAVLVQHAADRSDMVVDDVEDDREAGAMSGVDQTSHVVWRAVVMEWCTQENAVVAPAETAGEFGDRHDLDRRDPECGQIGQPLLCRGPRP